MDQFPIQTKLCIKLLFTFFFFYNSEERKKIYLSRDEKWDEKYEFFFLFFKQNQRVRYAYVPVK